MTKRRWIRWTLGTVVGLFALTAFVHTKTGLRTIAWITGSDGCPFGGAKPPMTAAHAEQLRVAKLDRGTTNAPARPAHGFKLDADRRADIAAWVAKHGLACKADKSTAGLRCEHVDGRLLPEPSELELVVSFGFDPSDRLVSLQLQSARETPNARVLEVATAAMRELEALGNAVSKGDALSAPAFVHRSMKVAYRDYTASVIASNVGTHLMTSVAYQSIPADAVAVR